jgi:hypothetical protein
MRRQANRTEEWRIIVASLGCGSVRLRYTPIERSSPRQPSRSGMAVTVAASQQHPGHGSTPDRSDGATSHAISSRAVPPPATGRRCHASASTPPPTPAAGRADLPTITPRRLDHITRLLPRCWSHFDPMPVHNGSHRNQLNSFKAETNNPGPSPRTMWSRAMFLAFILPRAALLRAFLSISKIILR